MFDFMASLFMPSTPPKKSSKLGSRNSSSKGCVLPRLSLTSDFWDAYESDYSESDAESLKEYEKDGYHPVHVGETLNDRYSWSYAIQLIWINLL